MQFNSPAFAHGEEIPVKFTCDGTDVSPAVEWTNAPEQARSFVITCDDPDAPAGTWLHWLVYDIPGPAFRLVEKLATSSELPGGMKQGLNSFGRIGWGGPCPPSGRHRYFFTIHAMDVESLGVPAGAQLADVEAAMDGHVLAEAQLMGTYER